MSLLYSLRLILIV